jgi:hypothetical protein
MSMCGVAAKTQERLVPDADLLSVCLHAAAVPLCASNGIDSKMRTILYGRQLDVSFESPFRCRFEPLPRLPPACLFAHAALSS